MTGRLAAGILPVLEGPPGVYLLFDFATDSLTCDPQDIQKSFYDMFMVSEGFEWPSVQFQAAISWCDMYLLENNREPHYLTTGSKRVYWYCWDYYYYCYYH